MITLPNKPEILPYYLKKEFIEWFVGFTDGEGNFNIRLTDLIACGGKYF